MTDAEAEFDLLFASQAARVVRFAALLGADDPDDVAQEAFTRMYANRHRLQQPTSESQSYLNRTVVNLVRDRYRRRQSAHRGFRLIRRDAEDVQASPESEVVRTSEARRVLDSLDKLSRRRREAVVMRYWLDLSYSEIADAMGIATGTAKSAVSRGLDELHALLTVEER